MTRVVRRVARAILIDNDRQLVLVRRTPPGRAPYWTCPGGGVEPADLTVEHGMVRELREELGAQVSRAQQVFLISNPAGDAGVTVQHFFVCHVDDLDMRRRSGPEFTEPGRGGYHLDRVAIGEDGLLPVDLKPAALKAFIEANWTALVDAISNMPPAGVNRVSEVGLAACGQLVDPPACLRQASLADSGFCYGVHQAAMREYVTAVWGWDEETQRAFHERGFDPSKTRIVMVDGREAGVLIVEYRQDEVYLERVEIHPDHQGHGIGTVLINNLLEEAADRGQAVVLDVLTVNHRAHALYRRLGFRDVTRHGTNNIKIRMRSAGR